MRQPKVWIRAGIVIMYGASIDASYHRHHAIQLVWPKPGRRCMVNSLEITTPVIIPSNKEHQLQMEEGWILLVEPSSTLGEALCDRVVKLSVTMLSDFICSDSSVQWDSPINASDDIGSLLTPLFAYFEQPISSPLINDSRVIDSRIKRLINELNQCLGTTCLKPNTWRASDVAATLALSESRFLHLFRQELGVPWRPYLLWCRMLCAVEAVFNGQSATDAAYMAGFADSAHLSRTFRKTFGMTIRQAKILFQTS
ncbi:helix-turn-helix transcriptional regulator [Vibrio nomapromontoriensis]|uniref:helix-turn-helix transcriptional regulator n=1 Tax=Vibrio nomapromontoriensis TaxID=2910246 RepID=UPI003D0EA49E